MFLRSCVLVLSIMYTANTQQLGPGPSAFTVTGAFPTSLFPSYYNNPTQTASQVQPIISDPVTVSSFQSKPSMIIRLTISKHRIFPLDLTSPDTIPLVRPNCFEQVLRLVVTKHSFLRRIPLIHFLYQRRFHRILC